MKKSILKLTGAQELSNMEQKNVFGGKLQALNPSQGGCECVCDGFNMGTVPNAQVCDDLCQFFEDGTVILN